MKKKLCWILILALLSAFPTLAAAQAQTALVLPQTLAVVSAEAFAGDQSIQSVVIPKSVERIESKAFAGCTGLKEVYLGNNAGITIAADAFAGCGDIHFYAYPDTNGELFALSHGYQCDLLEEGSAFLERAVALVEAYGGTSSILQSSAFAAKRLIVRMEGNALPNISAYNPIEIVRDGSSIFFVQFASVEETIGCYTQLSNDERVVFVEVDSSVEVLDGVGASGTVDSGVWDDDDPMGFEEYSAFVAANGSGKMTIAVIDSGVSQKAVYAGILRADGASFAGDNQDWSYDPHVHGSVIASIIKDCVGNANVDILPIRVVNENGVASLTLIGVAVKYAVSSGADVINMSLNFEENAYVRYCIEEAVSAGVDVVVAAGNSSRDISKVFPANMESVVTVSGIENDYTLSASSNYGANVSYCAPDSYVVTSAYPNIARKGTSFAAPMIASALALEKLDGYHSVSDLRSSCRDLGTEGKDSAYGYGLPQLKKLTSIDVTDLTINSGVPAQMAVGETYTLTWSVAPQNATDKTASCTVSDTKVLTAEKSETGGIVLKAVGAGTATVTVTSGSNKDVSAAVSITVVQPVTGIQVTGAKEKLSIGRTMTLTARVLPENATMKTIHWLSTNESVASVDASGKVTALSVGSASIYALALDGYGAQSAIVNLQVVSIPDPEKVVLTEQSGKDISKGSVRVQPGDQLKLSAAVQPSDAEQGVVWSCASTPAGAISVDQYGTVTVSAVGKAVVSATAENGVQASVNVESVILPTSITISGSNTVDIGSKETFTAQVEPANATDASITWQSSDSDIAMVNSSGVVIGVAPGNVQIIAVSNADSTVRASISVTVRQPYTLIFDARDGKCDVASKTAYSGYAVGTLPVPTRDYHTFSGWYTKAEGGTRVLDTSVLESSSTYTLYAHWTENPISDWVTEDKVPAGAKVVNTKTETTTSTSSTMSGWTQTGSSWVQYASATSYYAYFPAGFDQSNWYYVNFMKGPYSAYENETHKRTVSNGHVGYIYWHWMYDCNKSNGTTTRAIYHQYGKGPDNGFVYKYFGAWDSTKNYTEGDRYYCNSQSIMNYIVRDQKTSYAECQGALRWFKLDYYGSTYTDYEKHYSYSRTLVQYRNK